ncbi:MAG: PD-(D/E)XK nuclease domain-containing protein, partial [Clostridiales bacterium]|nr:PD-(D/E)XK nuclease domain-containing protein [Clostridiales bacterium]
GLFASIPYELHVDREAYYHSVFYAVMNVLGFDIDAEVSVSGGRVDAVLELEDNAYVMEFKYEKLERGAEPETREKLFKKALSEGMKQIKGRGYAKKYEGSGKKVHLAAFAFLGRDDIEMTVEIL